MIVITQVTMPVEVSMWHVRTTPPLYATNPGQLHKPQPPNVSHSPSSLPGQVPSYCNAVLATGQKVAAVTGEMEGRHWLKVPDKLS